eukprot:2965724-Rhodomonas_salina.1
MVHLGGLDVRKSADRENDVSQTAKESLRVEGRDITTPSCRQDLHPNKPWFGDSRWCRRDVLSDLHVVFLFGHLALSNPTGSVQIQKSVPLCAAQRPCHKLEPLDPMQRRTPQTMHEEANNSCAEAQLGLNFALPLEGAQTARYNELLQTRYRIKTKVVAQYKIEKQLHQKE